MTPRAAAALAEATAAASALPMAIAWAERAAAAVALDAGEPAAAAERALASAAAADRAGAVVEAACHARSPGGRSRKPATRRAAAELERAAAELDACGALRYRDAAERELRKRATTSIAGPVRAAGGWRRARRRSPSASSRWHGSWSTARPTPRSPRSCSQPEDRRDPHAQPVPKARRVLARGGRAHR